MTRLKSSDDIASLGKRQHQVAWLAGAPAYPAMRVTMIKDKRLRGVAQFTAAGARQTGAAVASISDVAVSNDEFDSHLAPKPSTTLREFTECNISPPKMSHSSYY